jgi:hypothetical protein
MYYFIVRYNVLKLCIPVTVVRELGNGCEYNEQCSYMLGKAQCKNHQCQCADGTTLNKETGICSKFCVSS